MGIENCDAIAYRPLQGLAGEEAKRERHRSLRNTPSGTDRGSDGVAPRGCIAEAASAYIRGGAAPTFPSSAHPQLLSHSQKLKNNLTL